MKLEIRKVWWKSCTIGWWYTWSFNRRSKDSIKYFSNCLKYHTWFCIISVRCTKDIHKERENIECSKEENDTNSGMSDMIDCWLNLFFISSWNNHEESSPYNEKNRDKWRENNDWSYCNPDNIFECKLVKWIHTILRISKKWKM